MLEGIILLNIIHLLQPSQPLAGILNFREAGIGVIPEIEEFFIMLYGFVCIGTLRF